MSDLKMLYFAKCIFVDNCIFPKFGELIFADAKNSVVFVEKNILPYLHRFQKCIFFLQAYTFISIMKLKMSKHLGM